jgi:Domain of Unknown Function (DUF928)
MTYANWFFIIWLILPFVATAAEHPQHDGTSNKTASMPIYKPPPVGTPIGRIGGGTRGLSTLPKLDVLAPNHVGLTTQSQPHLYWYLSKSTTIPIELTVIDTQGVSPLLEVRLQPSNPPGIQQVRLADYGIHLRKGIRYHWFVALILDAQARSKDVIAGGLIKHIEPSEALRIKLAQADKTQRPYLYAEAGVWYDAVAAISDQIDKAPNDPKLRQRRTALLEQVGLEDIVVYEQQLGN